MFLDLDLFREDMVSDFFSISPEIGSLRIIRAYSSEHALVANNSQREVVNSHSVILSTHHLGSHVSRCSRSVLSVVRIPHSCNAKISGP